MAEAEVVEGDQGEKFYRCNKLSTCQKGEEAESVEIRTEDYNSKGEKI